MGYAEDGELGKIKSSVFCQFGAGTTTGLDDVNMEFDYLALYLNYDGYSYYDTLNEISISVFQLIEQLELDNGYLYNTSSFKRSQVSLGSISFFPQPNIQDTLEIRLDETLGKEIYDMVISEDARIINNDRFVEYFKGLVIAPYESRQSCFLGFAKDASLRLYYQDNSNIPSRQKYLEFPMTTFFNQIQSDRSQTLLKSLSTQEEDIVSSYTDNVAYIQSGVGLTTKVNIPYLHQFIYQHEDLIITNAELLIKPYPNSFDKNRKLPSSFQVYVINRFNEIIAQFETSLTLREDALLGRDTYYSVNITSFVKEQLLINEANRYGLLFAPTSNNSSIDRVLLGDQGAYFKAQLKLHFLEVQ